MRADNTATAASDLPIRHFVTVREPEVLTNHTLTVF